MTHIIYPLIIGTLLFYMLDPLITLMEKKQKMKRGAAIVVVFVLLVTFITGFFIFVFPSVKSDIKGFVSRLPELSHKIDELSDTLTEAMFGKGKSGAGLRTHFESLLEEAKTGIVSSAKGIAKNASAIYKNVAAVILDVVTGVIFAYYFIKDKERISRCVLGIFPYERQNDVLRVTREIGNIVSSFARGQLTVAVIVGLIEGIGVGLIGLPVPWMFGIIGGASNLIPYIGPIIGAVPAALAALLISPWRGIITVLFFLLVQQIDNNFISPKIIEEKLGVHPVSSIIVILIGGELWGIGGILLAIPIYAILRCVFRYFTESLVRRPGRSS